jgi:U3 small nucleolar RNA-associated protein 14
MSVKWTKQILERRLRSPATRKRLKEQMRQFGAAIRQDFLCGRDCTIVPLSRGERSRPMAY